MRTAIVFTLLALMLVFSGMAHASAVPVIGTPETYGTTFDGWTNDSLSSDAAGLGVGLTGNWMMTDKGLLESHFNSSSQTMSFLKGATSFGVNYVTFPYALTWQVALSGDNITESALECFGGTISSLVDNLLTITLDDYSGSLNLKTDGLTIDSITFLGMDMGGGQYTGTTTLSALMYTAAATPIPGSLALLLSGLAGMVGIRRFVF